MSDQTDIERIIENQLSDLTLPCDMRDIRIRMAGAVQQCLAGKDAEIARLKEQLNTWHSRSEAHLQSSQLANKECDQLRSRLADAQSANDEKAMALTHLLGAMEEKQAKLLALESQCQKMRDALGDLSNRIEHSLTGDLEPDVEQELTEIKEAIDSCVSAPLDLELLNWVLESATTLEAYIALAADLDRDELRRRITALLKSLSPSPNPAK